MADIATLAELIVKVGADATQFEKYMNKLEGRLNKVGTNLKNVGEKLTTGLTLPLAAVGGGALKASIDFESAFAGVKKTVDATDGQLATLRQGIRDMAKETPTSALALAGIAEAAGQLGIKTDNILGFTRVVADLGVATNLSGEEGATALARLANITQMSQDQFDRLGSTIVALGNAGASTESEIVDMGLRIAGAGSQVGMTEAEILALANALSSVGIEADAGGSAISRVMIDIAEEAATGGEKLGGFAKVAGMSAAEFKAAWEKDPAEALASFIEGLGRLKTNGENVFGVLDDLGLSEVRVRDALLRAAGAGDLLRTSLETGNKAWADNTALANEAAQRYGTTESQMTIFWNRLKDVAITLGDALAPAFQRALTAAQPFINGLTAMATWFANLDPGMQQAIITTGLLVAALGPVLYIGGTMITTLSGLAGVFKLVGGGVAGLAGFGGKLAEAFALWRGGAGTFMEALALVISPTALVIAGIVALIAIGVVLYKHWDEISAWLARTWEGIKTVAVNVWNGIADFFTGLWGSITSALSTAWNGIKGAAVTAWNGITDFFREWWGTILLGIITGGLGLLVMVIAANWDTILTGINTAWETIKTTIATWAQAAWDAIVGVLTALPQWFVDMWDRAKAWTVDAWGRLKTAVVTGASDLKTGLIDGLEGAWNYLKGLPSKMWDWGKAAIRGLIEGFLSIRIPIPSFGIDWKDGPMGIRIPSLNIGVNWKDLKDYIPFLADGGVVDSPTLAMIGEAGREAVVPLDRGGGIGGGPQIILQWSSLARPSDSEVRQVAQLLNRELGRLMGGKA